ncbi:MAG: GGDEF domain-containing protein [Gammaproteobacteria bacterium]|jgi:diguanylate cyclase (GGDEF)-like protein|nr:MAG: GGDEF domain-containing protein [Gammaproteobacteria bacterium]
MITKQAPRQHRRDTWITLGLGVLGVLVYGGTVFHYDYFAALQRGEDGQAAMRMLDQMRRPFLALKQAEFRQSQSAGDASAIADIDRAISDGRRKLTGYLALASYNEQARQLVLLLQARYEEWATLELELLRIRAALAAGPGLGAEHNEMDELVYKNSSAFLTVMAVLGDGEEPINQDIDAGLAAARGLLVSSLAFIAYLIVLAFWRERRSHASELRLHVLAHSDSLTGLANRLLLDDRISVAISVARRYGHRLGIIYFDLDGFKAVNDELGHDAGDAVLKEVAVRLLKQTREMDTVARVGGDEFIVLMTNLRNKEDVHGAAGKLQAALELPFELRDRSFPLRASIGIAVFPDDGELPLQLLKHADAAMYEHKQRTRH